MEVSLSANGSIGNRTHLGDLSGAARGYIAAARVLGTETAAATERLSLAGRAYFEAGQFDRASDCYLEAVRRRVAVPTSS